MSVVLHNERHALDRCCKRKKGGRESSSRWKEEVNWGREERDFNQQGGREGEKGQNKRFHSMGGVRGEGSAGRRTGIPKT